MARGTNILTISPYDETYKDIIIKALETSKLDVQLTFEGTNTIVTLGAVPQDVKLEQIKQIKKLNDSTKENSSLERRKVLEEIKKLEKILGKDEAKRLEKSVLEIFDK